MILCGLEMEINSKAKRSRRGRQEGSKGYAGKRLLQDDNARENISEGGRQEGTDQECRDLRTMIRHEER